MNLLVRLLKVLILYRLRPGRLGLRDQSVLSFRVWPNDLDTNGHMNNGRYLTVMDLGRLDLLLRMGVFGAALRRRWNPVLGAVQVRFRRPLNLFQRFQVKTRIVCWDGKWVYLEQRLEREGTLLTMAFLKGVFVGPQGSVPITQVLGLLGEAGVSPPMPEALSDWLAAEEKMARAAEAG